MGLNLQNKNSGFQKNFWESVRLKTYQFSNRRCRIQVYFGPSLKWKKQRIAIWKTTVLHFGFKARSHERFLMLFSPFDGCERANQSRMFRWASTYSAHSLLIHSFTSIKRRDRSKKSLLWTGLHKWQLSMVVRIFRIHYSSTNGWLTVTDCYVSLLGTLTGRKVCNNLPNPSSPSHQHKATFGESNFALFPSCCFESRFYSVPTWRVNVL
jgi:hypothetical protein